MVKITNGISIFEVTNGAYESIYRHQGYQIMHSDTEEDFGAEVAGSGNVRKSADEIFVDELVEKPISQWNKDELKRYAAIKGISLAGTKNVNEAKEVVKKAMGAEE